MGDSGYGLRRYLMTPFFNPVTPGQQRYNDALTTTRARIEHTFGIVKNRFGCLLIPLRLMCPQYSCHVITVCFILHNIGVMNRDFYMPLPSGSDQQGVEVPGDNTNEGGKAKRMEYVYNFFS